MLIREGKGQAPLGRKNEELLTVAIIAGVRFSVMRCNMLFNSEYVCDGKYDSCVFL